MNRISFRETSGASDRATSAPRIRVSELRGVRLIEAFHEPGQRIQPHAHARATLLLSLGATFSEAVEDQRFEVQPLDVLWKPAEVVHANRYPLGARSFVVEMDEEIVNLGDDGDRAWDDVWHGRSLPAAICLALYHRAFAASECLSIDLEEAIVRVLQQMRGKRLEDREASPHIRRVRDLLLESLASPPALRDLAAEADLHPAHLCRAFRRQYGCSMGALVRRTRVERAVWYLGQPTARSLSDIAFALGYCDQAHFTRQFTQLIGIPPGAFRRLGRKQHSRQARPPATA